MHRPNFILTILGMLILALGIFISSILSWLVSNIIAIVAGFGTLLFFVFFLGGIYSYVKDTKMIKKSFDYEKANELILSLKMKTFSEAIKIFILMVIYALSWGIVIWFLQVFFR